MKLIKYKVSGFRCLRSIDWIPLKKLSIFTGQNDGGKTSALDSLNLLLNKHAKVETNDFTIIGENASATEIVIEAVFQLSPREKEKLDYESNEIFVKHVRFPNQTYHYSYKAKVHPDERLQHDLNTLSIDVLKEIADQYNITLSTRRTKETIVREIKQWLLTQTLQEGFLELPGNFLSELPALKIFRSAKTIDPESEVNQTLAVAFSSRIQSDKYSGKLAEIESEIEKELKNDLLDFEEIVKRYCSDITGIEIEPDFDFTRGFRTSTLMLKKSGGPAIALYKEGEGKKRRLTLAVYEWREKILSNPTSSDEKDVIVAFDEPDTHLDYISQRKILDIIRRISDKEKNSVITCTHSLNLIDRVPITDIVHFRKDATSTSIETLKAEESDLVDIFLYEISDCMGLKNSVMLNERCFLIVEGETELFSLPIIFTKLKGYSLQAGGIRLINGEGCGGVKTLAKFLNKNRRNVMFLIDRDTTNNPNAIFNEERLREEGFDINTQVFFTSNKEFEDEFGDAIYERASNTAFKKRNDTVWTQAEFSAMREGDKIFAKELVATLRRETASKVTKPLIGIALAKTITTEEIPESIKRCLEKALSLSS